MIADVILMHFQGVEEIFFSRSVNAAGVSTYRLNGTEVTYEIYEGLLQRIGVVVKARNFLVFQGDVESLASRSPLELTRLLSQISNADQYEDQYEDLLQNKIEAEQRVLASMSTKKMVTLQRREIKAQKDEAALYVEKLQELEDLKVSLLVIAAVRFVFESLRCTLFFWY